MLDCSDFVEVCAIVNALLIDYIVIISLLYSMF